MWWQHQGILVNIMMVVMDTLEEEDMVDVMEGLVVVMGCVGVVEGLGRISLLMNFRIIS